MGGRSVLAFDPKWAAQWLHVNIRCCTSRQHWEEHIWEFVRMGREGKERRKGKGSGPRRTPHSLPALLSSYLVASAFCSRYSLPPLPSFPLPLPPSLSLSLPQLYLPTSASARPAAAGVSAASCPCDTRARAQRENLEASGPLLIHVGLRPTARPMFKSRLSLSLSLSLWLRRPP